MMLTVSLEVSLMRLISSMVFRMASAPRSASTATSSERRAVSLAFERTWSMETSISFIDERGLFGGQREGVDVAWRLP